MHFSLEMDPPPPPPPPSQYPKHRPHHTGAGGPIPVMASSSHHSDNDRSSGELRALDCNLTSLCDHIQLEGFNNGSFSDIVVHAMGSTYHLHRLILSRSSYFRYPYVYVDTDMCVSVCQVRSAINSHRSSSYGFFSPVLIGPC